MFCFFSTNTSITDGLFGDCNRSCHCLRCEALSSEKKDASIRKHSPLFLNICFDSIYNHQVFRDCNSWDSYTNRKTRPATLSIESMTPVKILECSDIPVTTKNINRIYNAYTNARIYDWTADDTDVIGFHFSFYKTGKLRRCHYFGMSFDKIFFEGISSYDNFEFSQTKDRPELLYNTNLAQLHACEFPNDDITPEISASFSRTTTLNCSLLRNNRTHDVFVFTDPIEEQTLNISCADIVDGYLTLKRDDVNIKICGVIGELYNSSGALYAHIFVYFPKDLSETEPLLIDGICKTLKVYMLTDEDCSDNYSGDNLLGDNWDYRFNTDPVICNTFHKENETENGGDVDMPIDPTLRKNVGTQSPLLEAVHGGVRMSQTRRNASSPIRRISECSSSSNSSIEFEEDNTWIQPPVKDVVTRSSDNRATTPQSRTRRSTQHTLTRTRQDGGITKMKKLKKDVAMKINSVGKQ